MSKYRSEEPSKKELENIEKTFNPDKLKSESIYFDVEDENFQGEEFFEFLGVDQNVVRRSKEELLDLDIAELLKDDSAINRLRWADLDTVRDIVQFSKYDLAKVANLKDEVVENIVAIISNLGLELRRGCSKCKKTLADEELENRGGICNSCQIRLDRMKKAKDVTLELYSSTLISDSSVNMYVDVANNTSEPIKIELKECSIFSEGKQHNCESGLCGYDFSDGYIFPNSIKNFTKKWKTNWSFKDVSIGDFLTIVLKVNNSRVLFYKYEYVNGFLCGFWEFYDYYEMDD